MRIRKEGDRKGLFHKSGHAEEPPSLDPASETIFVPNHEEYERAIPLWVSSIAILFCIVSFIGCLITIIDGFANDKKPAFLALLPLIASIPVFLIVCAKIVEEHKKMIGADPGTRYGDDSLTYIGPFMYRDMIRHLIFLAVIFFLTGALTYIIMMYFGIKDNFILLVSPAIAGFIVVSIYIIARMLIVSGTKKAYSESNEPDKEGTMSERMFGPGSYYYDHIYPFWQTRLLPIILGDRTKSHYIGPIFAMFLVALGAAIMFTSLYFLYQNTQDLKITTEGYIALAFLFLGLVTMIISMILFVGARNPSEDNLDEARKSRRKKSSEVKETASHPCHICGKQIYGKSSVCSSCWKKL